MLVSKKTPLKRVASIILAGGQGTRLYPLTQTRSKPAVCFGGSYRLIDIPISNSLNAKIEEIFVISQYFATSLQQHILEAYHLDSFRHSQIHILSPEETTAGPIWFKGTADAIRQNKERFKAADVDFFLILSGDQLYNIDFIEMISFAKQQDKDLIIAALPVEKEEAQRMGLLKLDQNHQIIDFIEKPKDPSLLEKYALSPQQLKDHELSHPEKAHYLASMGIYVFKKQALLDLVELPGDDFGKNLIPLCVQSHKASAYVYKGYWEDIGTISSYYNANMALLQQKHCLNTYDPYNPIFAHPHNLPSPLIKNAFVHNSILSQGSFIEASEVTNSIIGVNLHIGKESKIEGSILLGSLFKETQTTHHPCVGSHCVIKKAIIDEDAKVGNRVTLTNVKQLYTYDSPGIYIRDGVIIVSAGTLVPDGFTL